MTRTTPLRMRRLRRHLWASFAAAGVLVPVLFVAGTALPVGAAGTSTRVSNTTAVRCGFGSKAVPTDWYVPATGTPTGLVWLQHGFSENKGHWSAYAPKL